MLYSAVAISVLMTNYFTCALKIVSTIFVAVECPWLDLKKNKGFNMKRNYLAITDTFRSAF